MSRFLLIAFAIILCGCQVVIVRSGKDHQGQWNEKTVILIAPPPLVEEHRTDKIVYPGEL